MTKKPAPSDKLDQYMLRLPDGMRDRIKAVALKNNRSMNAEIVATLEKEYPEVGEADAILVNDLMAVLADEGAVFENKAAIRERLLQMVKKWRLFGMGALVRVDNADGGRGRYITTEDLRREWANALLEGKDFEFRMEGVDPDLPETKTLEEIEGLNFKVTEPEEAEGGYFSRLILDGEEVSRSPVMPLEDLERERASMIDHITIQYAAGIISRLLKEKRKPVERG